MKSTICARSFRLGCVDANGTRYIYTACGEYRTLEAALVAQRARKNRAACDVIICTEQLATCGVNYGCRDVLYSALDGEKLS